MPECPVTGFYYNTLVSLMGYLQLPNLKIRHYFVVSDAVVNSLHPPYSKAQKAFLRS